MKICSKCHIEKDESGFYKNKRTKDGINGRCIDCCRITWYRHYNKKKQEQSGTKKCCSCKNRLNISNFNVSKRTGGIKIVCIECENKNKFNFKICKKCNESKELVNFYYRSDRDYYENICQTCSSENRKERYKKLDKIEVANKNKIYYNKNRQKIINRVREYTKRYRKTTIGKLQSSIHKSIRRIFEGCNSTKTTEQYNFGVRFLGCSFENFRKHIESLWLSGMSWENYGLYGWHVDHIIPVSTIKDINNIDQIKKVCHYTNLQPLWAIDNLKKGSKIILESK